MVPATVAAADWQDRASYAELANADRAAFAWEWLRRRVDYRQAWLHRDEVSAADFGLCRFVPPDLGASAARVCWTRVVNPAVLLGRIVGNGHDAFDVRALGNLAMCIPDTDEHWLFSNGLRSLRVDIVAGSLRAGPAAVCWELTGMTAAAPALMTLRRLIALAETGTFARSLFPRERRAARWAVTLRVHDALAAGASHREIAATLLGETSGARWRILAPEQRLYVQRLSAAARRFLAEPSRSWLDQSIASAI